MYLGQIIKLLVVYPEILLATMNQTSLPEREVPQFVQKSEEEPVLMSIGKDINV